MKNIKKILSNAAFLYIILLLSVACSSKWDDYYTDTENNTSAYDLLKAQSNFSEFLILIEQYQLDYLLKGSVVTVFAPVNGTINTTGIPENEVKNLLRQHIVSGRVTAELASGRNYFASNGSLLLFDSAFSSVNGTIISQQGTQKSGSVIHKVASLMSSSSKETLYGFLKKNKANYSYILSLYDAVTFDEKASIKYVGTNGALTYDSVFLAKSSLLDPLLSGAQFSSVILFTDQQFDNAVAASPAAIISAVSGNTAIKKGLITRTLIQSLFKGSKSFPSAPVNWEAVNGTIQTINPSKLSSKIDVMQNINVMQYNNLSSNLGTNYFNLLIQADEYNLSDGVYGASGGTNAHEVISVPVYAKGNGFARRVYPNSTAGNSHAYFIIGGVQKGAFVPALNGVTYIVKMSVSLTRSMKCKILVYDLSVDKQLYLDSDINFDISKNFICSTLDGGMRLIEFPAQLLYTRVANGAPTFKVHIDYRPLTLALFPQIGGVAPTVAQSGIVIDYIEFVPVFN
jgi:hypothetical protein